MKKLVLVITVVALVAAGWITYNLMSNPRPVSASQVVSRVMSSRLKIVQGLGPNSTFHMQVLVHRSKSVAAMDFSLPLDYRQDNWIVFDDQGIAKTVVTQETDLNGVLYQESRLDGNQMIIRDFASGVTRTAPSGPINVQNLIGSLADLQNAETNLVNANQAAPTGEVNGTPVFVIQVTQMGNTERVSVARDTYQVKRVEELMQGTPVISRDFTAFEVKSGNTLPAVTPILVATNTPAPTDTPPVPATPLPN